MFNDPYDSFEMPRVLLRPLALAGVRGSRVALTAAALSQFSGISLADLERRVEHQAGRSLRHIAQARGALGIIALERGVLPQILRESPPPIIALSALTLTAPDLHALLIAQAQVVFLDRPAPYRNMNGERLDALPAPPPLLDGVRLLDVGDQHPIRVARLLLSMLEQAQG